MFGACLRKETRRIESAKFPACVNREYKLCLYWKVMDSTAAILFSSLFVVFYFQQSPQVWITPAFRFEFQDEGRLQSYSGCYGINDDSLFHQRYMYNSDSSITNTSFGYCKDEQIWVLFEANEDVSVPCDASDKEVDIACSTKTEDFDIATSFTEPWFPPEGPFTPIDAVFWNGEDSDLYCKMALGDGVWDSPFNGPGYDNDNGDCCAATCTHADCGRGGLTNVFGTSDISGVGFPSCIDPRMHPITIQLNDITSSRDQ
jgi:hypothetical protein